MEASIKPVDAIQCLSDAFRDDATYANCWHSNLSMCAQDEGVDREAANRIASRFMKLAFGVVTKEVFREDV